MLDTERISLLLTSILPGTMTHAKPQTSRFKRLFIKQPVWKVYKLDHRNLCIVYGLKFLPAVLNASRFFYLTKENNHKELNI